ncbi:hypothetical protein, partial [Streptomyces sp. NPDC005181]|uniref:hypothetical protein n=1 Tax=Streptomyces sp. NPDC005181 TaxID=3156869 RepID=UPI0033B62256
FPVFFPPGGGRRPPPRPPDPHQFHGMAEAEVRCNYDSGLMEKWYEIDSSYQRKGISAHKEQLRKAKREFQKRVSFSKKLLARN